MSNDIQQPTPFEMYFSFFLCVGTLFGLYYFGFIFYILYSLYNAFVSYFVLSDDEDIEDLEDGSVLLHSTINGLLWPINAVITILYLMGVLKVRD